MCMRVGVDMVIESGERFILCVKGRRHGGERPILRRRVEGGVERREQGARAHAKKAAAATAQH